jgi:hypothetical protein
VAEFDNPEILAYFLFIIDHDDKPLVIKMKDWWLICRCQTKYFLGKDAFSSLCWQKYICLQTYGSFIAQSLSEWTKQVTNNTFKGTNAIKSNFMTDLPTYTKG